VVFDDSRWPLLLIAYGPDATISDLEALYERWARAMLEKGRHGVIIDFRRTNPFRVDAKVRKFVADEVHRRSTLFARFLAAEVRVVPHPLMRGVVTAFDWLMGSTFKRPLRNLRDLADAEQWLLTELAAQGLHPPTGALA
jgi:hypothetical protein